MKKYLLTICTIFLHTFSINNKVLEETIFKKVPQNNDDVKDVTRIGGIHSATWYNPHGARTASGSRFHKDSLTCAYNFTKMGKYLKVTNVLDSSSIVVKVTDRMGNKSKNHIDLSKCAFDSIGNPKAGRLRVFVEEIK